MSKRMFLSLLAILIFATGLWIGETSYKRTCEPLMNAQGQHWLECDKSNQ